MTKPKPKPAKFKHNPYKMVHENSNSTRAFSAKHVMEKLRRYRDLDTDAIRDLIADALHLSDSLGYDSNEVLQDACENWRLER